MGLGERGWKLGTEIITEGTAAGFTGGTWKPLVTGIVCFTSKVVVASAGNVERPVNPPKAGCGRSNPWSASALLVAAAALWAASEIGNGP